MNRTQVQRQLREVNPDIEVTMFCMSERGYAVTFKYDDQEFDELLQTQKDLDELKARLK